jgi:hypothetical protein
MPKQFYSIGHRGPIHKTSFSLKLINQPNKLDRYITLSWKGLPVTETPTYFACS